MKKMIVMAVLGLMGTQFANAQVKKGNFLIGGNVGVSTSTTKPDGSDNKITNTSFGISPKAGYALSDKWMIGVFVGTDFGTNKEKVGTVETKTQHTEFTPGVFVRNYHNLGDSKFAFFGEANVGYGFRTNKTNGTETAKINTISANLLPGISYFVTKHFVLEGSFGGLNYSNISHEAKPSGAKTKTNSFDLTFTKEINVGVSFLF